MLVLQLCFQIPRSILGRISIVQSLIWLKRKRHQLSYQLWKCVHMFWGYAVFIRIWPFCWEETLGKPFRSREAWEEAIATIQMWDDGGLDQVGTLEPELIVKIGPGRCGQWVGKVRLKEWERRVARGCNGRTQGSMMEQLWLMPQINYTCEWLKWRWRNEGEGRVRSETLTIFVIVTKACHCYTKANK